MAEGTQPELFVSVHGVQYVGFICSLDIMRNNGMQSALLSRVFLVFISMSLKTIAVRLLGILTAIA